MTSQSTTTNIALCFIKPHANVPSVERLVLSNFEDNGIRVVSQGVAFAEDIDKNGIIDKHYGFIARCATKQAPGEMPITPEGEGKFAAAFEGETWKGAVEAGRIFNAKDAVQTIFGGDEDKMTEAWKAPIKSQKLGPGFYAAQIKNPSSSADGGAETLFLINGFYPSMRKKFTKAGSSVRWFVIQFPEVDLSWSEFRSRVCGATNPAMAASESIRAQVLRKWQELGLPEAPDGSNNAIHCSASPLEAVGERLYWLNSDLRSDRFGRALLDAGVDPLMIQDWLENPSVSVSGKPAKPIFDILEDSDTSYVINFMADYARVHGTTRAGGGGAGAANAKRGAGRNFGLLAIKPAANNSDVQAFVTTKLRGAGVVVKAFADVVADANIVEKHFADLAFYAGAAGGAGADSNASSRVPKLDVNEKSLFRSAFSRDYDETVEAGLVVTAQDAMARLNFCSADRLLEKWSTGTRQRFSPSLTIGHLTDPAALLRPEDGIYVLNGFFPSLVESFVGEQQVLPEHQKPAHLTRGGSGGNSAPKKKTRILHLEWDEKNLSWAEFLSDVIGNVDPLRARPGSLRAQLYAQWRSLGLTTAPDVLHNGFSVSGSPIEALNHRLTWFGGRAASDVFGQLCLVCGVPEAALASWLDGSAVSAADIRGWDSSKVMASMAGQRVASALSAAERQYLAEKGVSPSRASSGNGGGVVAAAASPSPAAAAGGSSSLSRSAVDLLGGVDNGMEEHQDNSRARARSSPGRRRRAGSPNAEAILTPRRRAAIHGGNDAAAAAAHKQQNSVGAYGDVKRDGVDLAPPRPASSALHSPRQQQRRNPGTSDQFGLTPYSQKYGKDAARQRQIEEFMMRELTDRDLQEGKLQEYFSLFAGQDNFVDRAEMKQAYRKCSWFGRTPSSEEIDALFAKFDYNHDNVLSFDEFALLIAHRVNS